MQTSAATPETSVTTPAYARFKADRLKWVYAARADALDPRAYLQKFLVEPAPEGGVYLVATNDALIMIAYDAEGMANSRFTFHASDAIANLAGFPEDEIRLFNVGEDYADTIIIDGHTLHACREAEGTPTVLSHPAEIGYDFPTWQAFVQPNGERHSEDPWVGFQMLATALAGIPEDKNSIRFTRYTQTGTQPAPYDAQPIHIEFEDLPLRGVLMPVTGVPGSPINRGTLPFDAA